MCAEGWGVLLLRRAFAGALVSLAAVCVCVRACACTIFHTYMHICCVCVCELCDTSKTHAYYRGFNGTVYTLPVGELRRI